MSSYVPVTLVFFNSSPKIVSLGFMSTYPHNIASYSTHGQTYRVTANNFAEAEKMISYGLVYAQAVSLTVWLGYRPATRKTGGSSEGYRSAFTDRKHWKHNISEILPPDVYV